MTGASRPRGPGAGAVGDAGRAGPGGAPARALAALRRANAPVPPEHSAAFRTATLAAVLAAVGAAASAGEVSGPTALAAGAAICGGMLFSWHTRERPRVVVKALLAVAVLAVFAVFVEQVLSSARSGLLTSVETPLAGLFLWVQVLHSFDVPARRDLLFSLAASGALVAVAGAQALDSDFGLYVAAWLAATLAALLACWASQTGSRVRAGTVAASAAVVTASALAAVALLPPPQTSQALALPASLGRYVPLLDPTGLAGGNGQPAQPGRPGGATGVGGYLGFAGPLDTALRASLGREVVMRVRASRPGYFLGMTYDTWNGQSWLQSRADRRVRVLHGGSPFSLGPTPFASLPGSTDIQTFYVSVPLPNLLFAVSEPTAVYFPGPSLVVGADGSLRSTVAITPGTVYTVVSADSEAPPPLLAADRSSEAPYRHILAADLQLPRPYRRVAALARAIVRRARARTVYAQVTALEAWMARHVHYSLDIPPLRPGEDAVDAFLFGTRVGYCEQISTALAVMLRTLGIPAREAIGYIPGSFNVLTDLYVVRADDAHAWVQVWFPGHGWQNFDPTAEVPLAPPDPAALLAHALSRDLAALPWPLVAPAGALAVSAAAWRRRRRRPRPPAWPGRAAERLERAGRRAGAPRRPSETLPAYLGRLAESAAPSPGATAQLSRAAELLEAAAYGPSPATGRRAPPSAAEDLRGALHALHALRARDFRARRARLSRHRALR